MGLRAVLVLFGLLKKILLSVATILYVANYLDSITSLELTGSNLIVKAITPGCGEVSSWLTLDPAANRLFCMDENSPNGTISSFETRDDGSLLRLNIVTTQPGTVASTLFGQGNGLAVAYYSGASVATFDVSPKKDLLNPHAHGDLTTLQPVQAETYHLAQPGANALRQEQPHPHHAIIDPSGQYLLVPDLGADLVRIYLLNDDGRLRFTALAPLVVPAGSGPRHGEFLVTPAGETYFYLTSEIANTITGFKVTYTSGSTVEFTEVYRSGSHGLGVEFERGRLAPDEDVFPTLAGELHVSPDGNFLLVSSRNEGLFSIANPTGHSSSAPIPSDPIMTFRIDTSNGNLTKLQDFAAGGMVPRQFSISNDGSMVAVGLQQDGRVVVLDRDVQSGLLLGVRAAVDVLHQPTCVLFREESM
ncbi:Lactonase, 7-bladed beta-propeller-domain-containing protein [Coniella lustricola]|uniref:Lactonase, 7-bladed beta-propeller-domain-containing protein n=1 Tax=Coniella lustricola TaxID=2025994 RepID=A0A2T3AKT8_9PEZI|nr:Lactonase, 7-bladed beta-propeller-domain-containing protein [Coniella lustricola]